MIFLLSFFRLNYLISHSFFQRVLKQWPVDAGASGVRTPLRNFTSPNAGFQDIIALFQKQRGRYPG